MDKIKTYNLFLESNKDIDIYVFSDMIGGWNKSYDMPIVKKYSERFIGPGIFDRVSKIADDIFYTLEQVDVEHLKGILYDVFDELPEKEGYVYPCVLNCRPENLKEPVKRRFRGSIGVGEDREKSKRFVICSILKDIVSKTFFFGYPSVAIRRTHDELYVTDPKWNCVNFNIDNYEISKKVGQTVDPVFTSGKNKETYISQTDIDNLRKYKVESYFECYKPGVFIQLDRIGVSNEVTIKRVEDLFDMVMPGILNSLDVEEVIWDDARFDRKFDAALTKAYDYTLKLLLK